MKPGDPRGFARTSPKAAGNSEQEEKDASGLHKVSNVLVGVAIGVSENLPVVLSPKLEGGLLVEIGEGGVRKNFCGSLVFALLIEDVSILEFDQSSFEVGVNNFHDLLEGKGISVHLDVGVEDLAFGGDGFTSRSDVFEHSGRRGDFDGTAKGGRTIPTKGQVIGLFTLVTDIRVESEGRSSRKGSRGKGW